MVVELNEIIPLTLKTYHHSNLGSCQNQSGNFFYAFVGQESPVQTPLSSIDNECKCQISLLIYPYTSPTLPSY